jgi:hypothetical protein
MLGAIDKRNIDRGVKVRIYLDGTQLADREQAKVFNEMTLKAMSSIPRPVWTCACSSARIFAFCSVLKRSDRRALFEPKS